MAPIAALPRLLAAALAALPLAVAAQVSSFDGATGLVTIPSVSVGSATYVNMTLLHTGNFVFALQGATPQVPATPGVAGYDLTTNRLTLPAVKVGSATYLDVVLLNTGNFSFALQTATALPATTLDAVKAFLAAADALFATTVPATGTQRLSLADACWRDDGRTKANFIAEWDSDATGYQQRNAYQIGRQSTNVQVLALRNRANGDGSTRQEIDVQFDTAYADGTVAREQHATLISGSSAGTPGCATPQTSTALRSLGNQQLVATGLRARNVRDERHAIGTGAALSPAVNYRRSVHWQIIDPMGNASHVIVSGPGPAATVGGVATQFALKFISPRLLKSAPELQGKPGNFLNWRDDDAFRWCRAPTDPAVPSIADCTGRGATAFDYGVTTATPNAAADDSFAAQGWASGGIYRFDVYNDDGWKTANGHVGRTPIATYYNTLPTLPQRFVDMAGGGPTADKFPRMSFGALSLAQLAANITSSTPASVAVTWNLPGALPDGRKLGLFQGWEFNQGPRVGNAAGTLNPGYRSVYENYPGTAATSNPAWTVHAKLPDQGSKTYAEFTLMYVDRNDLQVISIVSLQ